MVLWRYKMRNSIKIAFRNTFRNKRRTLLSILAIAMGAVASLLIGSFVSSIYYGMQTGVARGAGHLHLHKDGFFKYGSAKVGQYDMANYIEIIEQIKSSKMGDEIRVITPVLTLGGIVSNASKNSSQTFTGIGMIADDHKKMHSWDGFNLGLKAEETPIESLKLQKGLIGHGLAVNLDLCDVLGIEGCLEAKPNVSEEVDEDIASFSIKKNTHVDKALLDILVSPANGAPNIISLELDKVWKRDQKNLDDRFVALPLALAQSLLYGSDDKKVNSITIQLKDAEKAEAIKSKLHALFLKNNWDLEIITLAEFFPQFKKVLAMFGFIFGFVSLIIAVIILFTVSNTMTMSVMERYQEIGTLRAIGLKRWSVKKYFILEGMIIGFIGASSGLILTYIIVMYINNSGITWSPPSGSGETLLILQLTQNPILLFGVWLLLFVVSILSSFFPANKAAKMPIVDALKYN